MTNDHANQAAQLVAEYYDHGGTPKLLAEWIVADVLEHGLDSVRERAARFAADMSMPVDDVRAAQAAARERVVVAILSDESVLAAAVDLLPADARAYGEKMADHGLRPFSIGIEDAGSYRCDLTGAKCEGLAVVVRCRHDDDDSMPVIHHLDGVLRFSVYAVRNALGQVLTS